MDGSRFDTLARQLASSRSRRTLLRGLAGGVLAAAGVGRLAQASCPREQPIRCGDTCVDLRTDPNHCGRCGTICASGLCYAGRCLDACPSGFEACGDTCLRACGSSQVRQADCTCCTPARCGGDDCGAIADGCGGTLDCGACCAVPGEACPTGDGDCCSGVCVAGTCQAGQSGLDDPCDGDSNCTTTACCVGICRDLMTDDHHCGTCGNVCFHPGQVCLAGACVCPVGTVTCHDECMAQCSARPEHYRDRFQVCYNQGSSCAFCTGFMGCHGTLDTETECGPVMADCFGAV